MFCLLSGSYMELIHYYYLFKLCCWVCEQCADYLVMRRAMSCVCASLRSRKRNWNLVNHLTVVKNVAQKWLMLEYSKTCLFHKIIENFQNIILLLALYEHTRNNIAWSSHLPVFFHFGFGCLCVCILLNFPIYNLSN